MKKFFSGLSIAVSMVLLFSIIIAGVNSKEVSAVNANSMLNSIFANAKSGKVINSAFCAKTNTLDDVIKAWGNPDTNDYVAAAKGSFATYNKQKVVFGYNKGMQVFEVRDMDSSTLKVITFNDIQKKLGKPQYESKDNVGRRIIGYKVSDNFKLEFVLQNSSNSAQVHHYNVFYPAGTVNSMASDPGRQW